MLLTAVRGCDTAPKDDPSKMFCRMLRGTFLVCHCGDPMKAQSFIESPLVPINNPLDECKSRFTAFRKNLDHYPHHYVMHIVHAVEIIGYYHPDGQIMECFHEFYCQLVKGLHVTLERKDALDRRLNADEDSFGKANKG